MADRHPDPDHPFDLALRRPARLTRASTVFSKPAVLGRPAFVLSARPTQSISLTVVRTSLMQLRGRERGEDIAG